MATDQPILSLLVPFHPSLLVEEVCRLAARAEELGFGAIWYGDERFERDPFAVLTRVAGCTERVLLGPAVCDPYTRHPALTSASVLTLNEISGGRARLGIGAGAAGFDLLGLDQPAPARSVLIAAKSIRALMRGETVETQGPSFRINSGRIRFEFAGEVPIHIAAEGPMMLESAHVAGDAVIMAHSTTPSDLRSRIESAAGAERQLDGPLQVVMRLDATASEDRDSAFQLARTRVGRVLWSQYPDIRYIEALDLELPDDLERELRAAGPFFRTHDLNAFRRFADLIPRELVEPVSLFGSSGDIAQQMSTVLGGGVEELMIHPLVPTGETLESCIGMIGEAFEEARSGLTSGV